MSRNATKQQQVQVWMEGEVASSIRRHCRSSRSTEVCGVLIGTATEGKIRIHAAISGRNAAQAGTHVTFTQDAWEHIYQVKDEKYPEDRIVGWYHSHPGFGIFLSEHDTFIQKNFFSAAEQIAWVFDPHTDEEGCFGWQNGDIVRLLQVSILFPEGEISDARSVEREYEEELEDGASPYAEEAGASTTRAVPGWLHGTVSLLSHLSVLVLGFALAYFLFPKVYVMPVPVNPVNGEPVEKQHAPGAASPTSAGPASSAPVPASQPAQEKKP